MRQPGPMLPALTATNAGSVLALSWFDLANAGTPDATARRWERYADAD